MCPRVSRVLFVPAPVTFCTFTGEQLAVFKVLPREFESTGRPRFDPRFVEPVAGLSIGH